MCFCIRWYLDIFCSLRVRAESTCRLNCLENCGLFQSSKAELSMLSVDVTVWPHSLLFMKKNKTSAPKLCNASHSRCRRSHTPRPCYNTSVFDRGVSVFASGYDILFHLTFLLTSILSRLWAWKVLRSASRHPTLSSSSSSSSSSS